MREGRAGGSTWHSRSVASNCAWSSFIRLGMGCGEGMTPERGGDDDQPDCPCMLSLPGNTVTPNHILLHIHSYLV